MGYETEEVQNELKEVNSRLSKLQKIKISEDDVDKILERQNLSRYLDQGFYPFETPLSTVIVP
jgi:hypothetical protein